MDLEQLDLIAALLFLRDTLTDVAVQALTDGPRDCPWVEIADAMERAAWLCKRQFDLSTQ